MLEELHPLPLPPAPVSAEHPAVLRAGAVTRQGSERRGLRLIAALVTGLRAAAKPVQIHRNYFSSNPAAGLKGRVRARAHTDIAAVAWQMSGGSLSCNNSITRYHPNLYSLTRWFDFFQRLGSSRRSHRQRRGSQVLQPSEDQGALYRRLKAALCLARGPGCQHGSSHGARVRRAGGMSTGTAQRNSAGFEIRNAILAQIMGDGAGGGRGGRGLTSV